ncbi:regulatory protein, luxR family [Pseudovibrio denitrificans]|uniref:Regulatory protein, luxR family n=1 Tax=Pseudovibrio denitrificans TaxID=258256 RepID=A0A1I7DPC8_9HYPH|nr:helix-turn-helix transcriptional regulator [Pseudovibrio denitrificans]SFU13560.1 regulatory protein, luxR family [Pseudovibrio denitrificans]
MEDLQQLLINRMYSTVVTGKGLDDILAPIAEKYRDLPVTFQVQCLTQNNYYHFSALNVDSAYNELIAEFIQFNPFPKLLQSVSSDQLVYSERFLSQQQLEQNEFYNNVLKGRDNLNRSRGFHLHRQGSDVALAAVTMPARFQGTEDEELCNLLERIQPHYQNAFSLFLKLEAQKRNVDQHTFWLEQIPSAAFILDHGFHIALSNQKGRTLLQKSRFLYADRSNNLATNHRMYTNNLENLLLQCRTQKVPVGPFPLGCETPTQPLISYVPLTVLEQDTNDVEPFLKNWSPVLAVILDPTDHPVSKEVLIQKIWGATNREADIAQMLIRGFSLKETASTLNMSYNTARNHIAGLTSKADMKSQSELISSLTATLSRMPETVRAPTPTD